MARILGWRCGVLGSSVAGAILLGLAGFVVGWAFGAIPSGLLPAGRLAVVPPAEAEVIFGGQSTTCPMAGSPQSSSQIDICDACGGPVTGTAPNSTTGTGHHSKGQAITCPDPNNPGNTCYESTVTYCDSSPG
jgi:hypothetical protein